MTKTVIFNKSKFLTELGSRTTGLESKTKATLKSLMQEEAESNVDDNLNELLKDFKSKVKVDPTIDLPDEVYMAAMQSVVAVEAPSISSPYYEGEIVKMLGAYVADLLNTNNKKITVGGTTYDISTPMGSTLGLVTVTVNNKTHILNWTDSSNLQKTLESFKTEVAAFGKANTVSAVYVALLKDATFNLMDSWVDALAGAKGGVARNIFKMLQGYIKAERDTSDVVGLAIYNAYNKDWSDNIFFKALQELTAKVFKKSNKQITSVIDKYAALEDDANSLIDYVSSDKIPTEYTGKDTPLALLVKTSEYKNFVKAFNALEDVIGESISELDYLIELSTGYKFTDAHDESINESRASVYGTSQNDSILINGVEVRVYSGEGDDNIIANGRYITIIGEAGNDMVLLRKEGDTYDQVDTDEGDDTIFAYSGRNTINGGVGNDTILVSYTDKKAEKNQIYGGAGNDVITVAAATGNTVVGEDGDDIIYVSKEASSNTISGVKGNDTINLTGSSYNVVTYQNGDGNDTIFGLGSNDTLYILEGDTSTSTVGADVVVQVGSGSITIKDGAEKSLNVKRVPTAEEILALLKELEKNKSIWGTSKDDSINNSVSGANINGGFGHDNIINKSSSVAIDGGADDDTISNYGDSVTINGDAGSDSIQNWRGYSVKIDGGDGNDSIDNDAKHVTINGGAGDDYIYNEGDNSLIDGNTSNDIINNYNVSNVTINGGYGNDSIGINWGSGITINGGAGNDYIGIAYGSNVTIDGGAANDTISYWGNSATINGGDGNDYIVSYAGGYHNTINADTGNDKINNQGNNATINGGTGDDFIINSGANVTINGGAGNDTIYLNTKATISNVYVYNFGDGNDEIHYATKYDTISIGGDTYSTQTSSSDLIIKVGSGAMTLVGAASTAVNIVGTLGTGDEENATIGATINNTVSGVTLNGTANKDSIMNYGGDEVLITADADADTIFSYGDSVTINAGAGDDIIDDAGINSLIDGGAGNDKINLFGGGSSSVLTVSGGLGDDMIYGDISAHIYQYAQGDGNDTIFGYNDADTLYISSGSISSASISGEDVMLKIGSGSVNLKAAKAQPIKLKISSGTVIETILGGSSEDTLPQDTDTLPAGISISSATLTASTAFTGSEINLADFATTVTKVNASALSRGISILGTEADNSLKGDKGADTIFGGAGNDTVSLGGGSDVYVYQSGNDLIQDYTAGTDKIKLASASITGSSLSGSNVVLKTSVGNLTVKGAKNQAITIIDSRGTETTKIYPETSSDTLPTGLSYDSAKKTLTVSTSYSGAAIDLANFATTTKTVDASKFTKALKITGSTRAESLIGGSKADTLIGGKGNDTLKGNGGSDIFVYSNGDSADVIADFTTGDKISLSGASVTSASLKSSDMVLKIGSGNLTVKNGKGKEISVGSSIYYNNLVYDAKKTAVTLASGFSGSLKAADYASTVKKIDSSAVSKSINIVGNSQANTIYGGTGNDKLYGEAGNDKLLGGAGADTLYGGVGADTLTGGDGKDVFVYANGDGADVIADFTATQDAIKLTSGTVASASLKGSDMVFKIGSGSLTIKNGKGKEISVGSAIYYNNFVYDAKKTTVTLASGFTGSLKAADYSSSVKKIDASAVSKSVNLVGNSQANTILGGGKAETIYGGTGNDSINGGSGNDKLYGEAGNDTLWGGAGNDTFVYSTGEGKDVIADYAAGDTIKISNGTITATGYKSNDVIFTVGSGTLTVKNGKGKAITITDAGNKTSTKTYTTGVTYGSNGTRSSNALWFTEDDTNFIRNDSDLDAISTANYFVTNVETAANTSDLSQNASLSTVLTFAK